MNGTSMGGREYTSGLISPDCAEAERDSGLSSPPAAAEGGCGEDELEAVDSSSRSELSLRESENEN